MWATRQSVRGVVGVGVGLAVEVRLLLRIVLQAKSMSLISLVSRRGALQFPVPVFPPYLPGFPSIAPLDAVFNEWKNRECFWNQTEHPRASTLQSRKMPGRTYSRY